MLAVALARMLAGISTIPNAAPTATQVMLVRVVNGTGGAIRFLFSFSFSLLPLRLSGRPVTCAASL
ncbi:hypothetical protein SCA03_05560 [Streptomyces cacaoi]|uniref:MFS transporter n=1 Tax=Streptomyces cacaoi TaxID=1898 RepID=A0A4Y3QRT1_STRCI|nr:hypothetical protein SCA03_05560 [Streptomyces cacaoi]